MNCVMLHLVGNISKGIKEDLKEIECKGLEWNNLSGDRDNWIVVLNIVVYVTVPCNVFFAYSEV